MLPADGYSRGEAYELEILLLRQDTERVRFTLQVPRDGGGPGPYRIRNGLEIRAQA